MRKLRIVAILHITIIICLLSFNTSFSQSNLIVEDITAKSNLPKGAINCLIQDSTGFVWIGTWKGLYRYDGYQAVNFSTINPKFNALKISTLHIDKQKLWVGSFVTGLFCIDLETYQITQYSKTEESGNIISDNDILTIESMDDGTVIAGTERGGMNLIYQDKHPIEIINSQNTPRLLQKNQVSQIIKSEETKIIIASNYISTYDFKTKQIDHFSDHSFDSYITKLKQISKTELLVATNDGLYLVSKNSFKQILNIRCNTIEAFKAGNSHTYLVGTIEGIYVVDIQTGVASKYIKQSESSYSPIVTAMISTNDKAILIGSETGLSVFIQRKQHFNNINTTSTDDSPTGISRIIPWNNQIYVASWGKGLLMFDQQNKKLVPITFSNYREAPPRFIYDITIHQNLLYFSCKNHKGIFSLNPNDGQQKLNYISTFNDEQGNPQNYTVTCTFHSNSGKLILGTWEGILFYLDEATSTFKILTDKNNKLPKSQNLSIFSIIEDQTGSFWVGINGGGVLNFKIEDNKITKERIIREKDGLISNFVTQLYQSRNNLIWIGTEKGLTVIENDKLKSVFNSDMNFDIQSIIEDPIGFLWIGTQKGLLRINSNRFDEPYKLFDDADGLQNRSFFLKSCASDNNLTYYFGGLNGIDYFVPYKIEYNYQKPIPVITQLSLFNEMIYPSSNSDNTILKRNIQYKDKLKLKYNQNTFSIEVSNLEYQIQDKCQYAFFLEGADKDWNYRDANNRTAYYTKLAPGTYLFKVKSTNNDGVWCDEPVELTIQINPPFWATTWAYIIYFIFIMVSIFLLTYMWIMKVNEKHQNQIKDLEYNKQKELEEIKLKFFTNISHEFRTPLTLILGPIARILESDPNNNQNEIHLMIYRNANRLLQLTNRILDFRKNEKDQLRLKVEPVEIGKFIENIFQFFIYEANKRHINYQFINNFNETIWIDTEYVESMLFNLLSNAFKYTPDGKSITIKILRLNHMVQISCTDTGLGMNKEQLEKLFDRYYSTAKHNSTGIGLSFTKRLVEIHKGEIQIKSEVNFGSEFKLLLPATDVYNEQDKLPLKSDQQHVDWSKINQQINTEVNQEIGQLKSQFNKDELIALIVDDNFEVRQFLRKLLDTEFRVIEASNGKEGLELAFENLPDIVISDVMMPILGGFELCERLKTDERTDHIPVILTTILSDQQNRLTGLSKGADSYIPKPIDPEHLLIRVQKLIEKQFKLKERFSLENYGLETKTTETEAPEVHPLIEKARLIILKNIDNSEYNIDNFCNDLGLSRMQLYRKFKAITGMSANSFIRKVRLHKAAELLKEGKMSVKEVTYDVGFTDLKYFRKCFFEEFGVNPSAYNE